MDAALLFILCWVQKNMMVSNIQMAYAVSRWFTATGDCVE